MLSWLSSLLFGKSESATNENSLKHVDLQPDIVHNKESHPVTVENEKPLVEVEKHSNSTINEQQEINTVKKQPIKKWSQVVYDSSNNDKLVWRKVNGSWKQFSTSQSL